MAGVSQDTSVAGSERDPKAREVELKQALRVIKRVAKNKEKKRKKKHKARHKHGHKHRHASDRGHGGDHRKMRKEKGRSDEASSDS